jgi:cytoskeletal protein CcmA (bactofilin family)
MARPPFGQPTPMPGGSTAPNASTAIPAMPRPAATPAAPAGRAPRDSGERRTLVVGRGISVQGTVQDAERLVVEGTVEASMIHAAELSISHGGVFKGEVEVEDAEIAGTIDGTLTARGSLVVRATGRLLGTARCRRLQVEDGGQITGRMEMLNEPARSEQPTTQPMTRIEAA